MPNHDWGELSFGMKQHYRNQGITAGTYNKWWRIPQAERTQLSVAARSSGYKDGLNFLAVQSAVRTKSAKKKQISVRTTPNAAAVELISGVRGSDNERNRQLVIQLFDFDGFERVDWENFLSP